MPLDAFAAELQKRRLHHRLWLEIEGIGDAFGNFAADSTWWSDLPGLPSRERFDRVLDLAAEVPNFSSQRLDHAGGRVSLGTCGVVIAERDGVLHRLFATRRPGPTLTLAARPGRGAGFVLVHGPGFGSWPDEGAAYIGRETVRFEKMQGTDSLGRLALVGRGAYRSRVIDHPVGTPITLHPTVLSDRRVWLWWGLGDDITNSMMAFSGHLESVRWRDGGTALEFQCADEQGNAKTPLFREAFAWAGGSPSRIGATKQEGGETVYYVREDSPLYSEMRSGKRREVLFSRVIDHASDNPRVVARNRSILSQVMILETSSIEGRWVYVKGAPSRTIVQTPPGFWAHEGVEFEVRPALLITPPKGKDSDDPWREHVIWKRGTHPLQVELQLLLSKNGDGANGYWDVLPPGYGYGIDEKRVDLDSFEALIDRTDDLRVETVITAPVDDGREWRLKNLYQPFGFYPRLVFGGRYSVGFIGDPPAEFVERARVITEDQIISWEGPGTRKRDVVDSFTFKADARISLEPPHEVENRPAYRIGLTR